MCTFCAIPLIRGKHRSREPGAIAGEIRWLVERGVKEVVLVAQDMSLYGRDLNGNWLLPSLLRDLGDIDGLLWLRMLYQYPQYVNDDLLSAVADSTPAVPYFDLSLQHASGKLVRKMRRWGDAEKFLALIERDPHLLPGRGAALGLHRRFPGRDREGCGTACRVPARGAARLGRILLVLEGRGNRGERLRPRTRVASRDGQARRCAR